MVEDDATQRGDDADSSEPTTDNSARLLPDGGEDESDEETEDEEADEPADDEETQEEEETEDEEAEEEEADEETEDAEEDESEESEEDAEEGADLVHLDLEGLFLDVLGLEVDLNEVVLNVSAQPGSNRLLGNLLSAVSGLLDSVPGSLLDGAKDSILGFLGDLFGGSEDEDGESDGPGAVRNALSSIAERIREALTNVVQQLPLEEIIAGVVRELVSQLLDKPASAMDEVTGDSESEESEEDEQEAEAEA